jgi:hypothetical protein
MEKVGASNDIWTAMTHNIFFFFFFFFLLLLLLLLSSIRPGGLLQSHIFIPFL